MTLTSLVLFGSAPAHACSCAPGSDREHAQRAETVFVGTISESSAGASTGRVVTEPVTYGVAVDRVFKGEVDRETTVVTAAHGTACGLPNLPEGKPLIFFASTSTAGLQVNSCDGTGPALPGIVQAVTAVLGEPRAPREPTDLVEDGDLPGSSDNGSPDSDGPDGGVGMAPWLAGAAALVAAALGGGVLLRQRRRS